MTLSVKVGDQLPSVGLRATDGYLLNLRTFVSKGPVAFLFFGGPTMEGRARRRGIQAAEALRDEHERLRAAGIAAVGVSCDSEAQQRDFVASARLPYLLFSDERRSAVEVLGIDTVARGENVNVARPVVIAADTDGTIRAIYPRVEPEIIVDLLLRALSERLPVAASTAGSGAALPTEQPG